ncbi:hypothetical protein [Nonomuraea dietziae]|uniref:hypothetical protein n=1 Tax=Nonomuraea dietziae TaxID=65515 RepID=UPI0033C56930
MIHPRTAEEKAAAERYAAAHARLNAARADLGDRDSDEAKASPYDKVASALLGVISDQVYAALYSPDFAHALEERGLRVGPALDEGEPPAAPWEWADEVLLFMSPDGTPVEPLELIDRLYAEAWRAGWEARASSQP